MVWLSSKNIKSTRPTKNLSKIWLNPFPILRQVSTHAYHLNGNPSTHSSIFLSLNQSKHQQSQIGLTSLILQSSLKKKRNGKSHKYWIQSSREENYGIWWNGKVSVKTQKETWEPAKNLKNCPELVKDFHSLYPDKSGSNSSRA
ncbi:hypothetical protein O181_037081 [Austropuccinia psidii MF-1]|uniref:Chromo domain-containing protein n=1 Tax=Austropuccinia psidii MF-1 TaxID=1389203 RepID=A0A9Q3HAG3_9BASI|nr:hypothetical protein [Austropuccinia psidii MF-1]